MTTSQHALTCTCQLDETINHVLVTALINSMGKLSETLSRHLTEQSLFTVDQFMALALGDTQRGG